MTAFLKAAKLAAKGSYHIQGACTLVEECGGRWDRILFSNMFQPSYEKHPTGYWLEHWIEGEFFYILTREEAKERRIIALLLAHAMRETGDL